MQKTITLVGILALVLIGAYLLFWRTDTNESEVRNETATDEEARAEVVHAFRDQMIARGIDRVGHPIEGFDSALYIMAFPGLAESDFDGVEAFEGAYRIIDGKAVF